MIWQSQDGRASSSTLLLFLAPSKPEFNVDSLSFGPWGKHLFLSSTRKFHKVSNDALSSSLRVEQQQQSSKRTASSGTTTSTTRSRYAWQSFWPCELRQEGKTRENACAGVNNDCCLNQMKRSLRVVT